jgi:hypothetical protein
MQNNPYIIIEYLNLCFKLFLKYIIKSYFKYNNL